MNRFSIRHVSLLILLAVALLGASVLTHYGESWDELLQYKLYARHALGSYLTWLQQGQVEALGDNRDTHGPSFVMLSELIARLALRVNPHWLATDVHHLVHFLTFLAGAAALYTLCRRWMGEPASLGASLLYLTQPVLWGHGFINPKDMPFASVFLISVALGFRAYDRLFVSRVGSSAAIEQILGEWRLLPKRLRWNLLRVTVLWTASILILFGGVPLIHDFIGNMIRQAYASPGSFLGQWFLRLASDASTVPPDVYIQKAFILFLRLRGLYILAGTAIVIWLYRSRFKPGLILLGTLLPAGLAVGFATSMRIIGPMAALLVCLYMLAKAGKKSWLVIFIYAVIAIGVMYCTWPYLWPDPVGRFVESILVNSSYPWRGRALFNGAYFTAGNQPWFYLPAVLAIQLTEPVWLLFAAGLTAAVIGSRRKRIDSGLLFLVAAWFLLPLIGFTAGGVSLYDNFRQVLFVLPPVFLAIGVFLDRIMARLQNAFWRAALILVLILPGIVAGIRLHPYEYVYYNSFVGGTGAAFRRFEMDYWGTSFREAARLLNAIVPANARVAVLGPQQTFEPFVRADLKLVTTDDPFDYVVISTRYNWDLDNFQDLPEVGRVERDGAVFAVIRRAP